MQQEEHSRVNQDQSSARKFLAHVAQQFASKPFRAHRVFQSGHAQTLAAYAWPRPYRFDKGVDDERLFVVDEGISVLAHCRWQQDRTKHSTMVIWHGMEGSTTSVYMIAMADKAFRAGFNVVRVNFRNCGGTEHLSPTLYHGGMTDDLRAVINELISIDGLPSIYPVGFSLGGNLVLKLAGEYADQAPAQVRAICAVSPSVDLAASTDLIVQRRNLLYHASFMRSLRRRIKLKNRLYPTLYDLSLLERVRTIKDFDEHFTSRSNGFANANDYYYRSSSVRVVEHIRIPTLIIHSADDPFIPFEPMKQSIFTENPNILVVVTDGGGHVAFIADKVNGDSDRFWAENRAVEFCELAETELAGR